MRKAVYTISLYPRANGPVKPRSVAQDVLAIVQGALLLFLLYWIALLLMGGF